MPQSRHCWVRYNIHNARDIFLSPGSWIIIGSSIPHCSSSRTVIVSWLSTAIRRDLTGSGSTSSDANRSLTSRLSRCRGRNASGWLAASSCRGSSGGRTRRTRKWWGTAGWYSSRISSSRCRFSTGWAGLWLWRCSACLLNSASLVLSVFMLSCGHGQWIGHQAICGRSQVYRQSLKWVMNCNIKITETLE